MRNQLDRAVPLGSLLATAVCAALFVFHGSDAFAAGIADTKHNLGSTSTAGNNQTTGTAEICVFCHTPHGANTAVSAPLWNKGLPSTTYTTYSTTNSTTIDGETLAVGSVSAACLSCHDGTQAMDNLVNAPGSGGYTDGGVAQGWTWTGARQASGKITGIASLTSDLTNDHPVGIQYCGGGITTANTGIGTGTTGAQLTGCTDPDFKGPYGATVNSTKVFWVETGSNSTRQRTDLTLYTRTFPTGGTGPSVECASCHDPHVKEAETSGGVAAGATFLRVSNAGSAVCLSCHTK